jgi:hypothetical protein
VSAGRFAEPVASLEALLRQWRDEGAARALAPAAPPWSRGRRLVLGADAALDLGTPAARSRAFLLWKESAGTEPPEDHELLLVGPDVSELVTAEVCSAAFGLLILARGAFEDEYDDYLDLKEALYGLQLQGLTLRSAPSQGLLRLRLHRDAVAEGFSFEHLGGALLEALSEVEATWRFTILFVVGDDTRLDALAPVADAVKRRVAALVKRNEEADAECDECEYQDICDEKEHEQ